MQSPYQWPIATMSFSPIVFTCRAPTVMTHAQPQPVDVTFRQANAADVPEVVELVNSAYRGDSSRSGWTTEADLLGGQRTDREEVASLINPPESLILLAQRDQQIIGSLHLGKSGCVVSLGMLAIKPTLQGSGLGTRFLLEAERVARQQLAATKMQMTVITHRHELIAYYQRRGYQCTGQRKPFPTSPRFGIPKVAILEFEVMQKDL